jgi:hypothetical protein
MNTAHAFRRTLAHRLLAMIAVSFPAASAAGCFAMTSCPEVDPKPTVACFDWPPPQDGGAPLPPDGGAGGIGGMGGAGGAGGSGGGGMLACPSRLEAQERLNANLANYHQVKSDGTFKNGQCCYDADVTPICEGRPYIVDEVARTAPFVRGEGDRGWDAEGSKKPRVDNLSLAQRGILAAEWTRDALFEHASVASFGRFAMELLAVGAPADLVEEAHRAALDEARHARLCFALASAYAGETIAPGAFPFDGRVEVVADLASIAARAAKEGCIGETVATVIAAEELSGAQDPAVRKALEVIAQDEARHAELAWRTVAWAIRVGDARVRAAVEEVFAELDHDKEAQVDEAATDERLRAHGRPGEAARRKAAAQAMEEVVRPAARRLLAASGDEAASRSAPREAVVA